jgi:DNA-binding transcriptional ArsR family regulator
LIDGRRYIDVRRSDDRRTLPHLLLRTADRADAFEGGGGIDLGALQSARRPARVRIVNLLAARGIEVCACEFEPALRLSQPTVSHHLKKLPDAGLLDREQRSKWAYFSLNAEAAAKLGGLVDPKEVTDVVDRWC